jgi:2-polyprenyl-3-methyl-5-hydroxy-6-metoxy-1,4-benzoquinol methylase
MNRSEKFWDRLAGNFDRTGENTDSALLRSVENARKYLTAEDIVLDYGCATGAVAFEIAHMVKNVQGIDISSKMIVIARSKAFERKTENVAFVQSTIFDDRFSSASFDVILAFNILHLLEDASRAIQRVNELLKPGGLMISSTGCLGEKKSIVNALTVFLTKIIGLLYVRSFKISELRESIEMGNFTIIETEILKRSPTICFMVAKKK